MVRLRSSEGEGRSLSDEGDGIPLGRKDAMFLSQYSMAPNLNTRSTLGFYKTPKSWFFLYNGCFVASS